MSSENVSQPQEVGGSGRDQDEGLLHNKDRRLSSSKGTSCGRPGPEIKCDKPAGQRPTETPASEESPENEGVHQDLLRLS